MSYFNLNKIKIYEAWGVKVINTTPHAVTFLNSYTGEVLEVPPCGYLLNAKPVEKRVGISNGVELVETIFEPTPEGLAFISYISLNFPNVVIVGSALAAQAYPEKVKMLVPCKGYERVPISQKRMRHDKFTVYKERKSIWKKAWEIFEKFLSEKILSFEKFLRNFL